ncbi:hypothetical protein SFRURICE_012970 [Spodoptera frugiperda]|nr:hypothetical protein SFRURICE_012970 [Spodoptera frugiperda]
MRMMAFCSSNTRAGLENLAKDCLSGISRWGERVGLLSRSSPRKNFSFIEHIKAISEKPKNNFYALTRISKATWGLSFLTLRIIYGATYLRCVCYGAPVWADRATVGAVRRKLLQGRLAQRPYLCSRDYFQSILVQRRAAMYYNARPNFSANFLAQRDRSKIYRLLKPLTDVWDELLTEWQCRWESSTKGRHLYQLLHRHELLMRHVDGHCCPISLLIHGNLKVHQL